MSRWILACVLLAVVSSGCASPATDPNTPHGEGIGGTLPWEPLPCDAKGPDEVGATAMLLPVLRQPPAEVAALVVGEFGDELVGEREVEQHDDAEDAYPATTVSRWTTLDGFVRVQSNADGVLAVEYGLPEPVTRADMEALLETLGTDVDTMWEDGPRAGSSDRGILYPRFQGKVVGIGFFGAFGASWGPWDEDGAPGFQVHIGRLHEFTSEPVKVTGVHAQEIARIFAACEMADEAWTPENGYVVEDAQAFGYMVLNRSVAHHVEVHFSKPQDAGLHCGASRWVFVDVMTGAVLGSEEPFCV